MFITVSIRSFYQTISLIKQIEFTLYNPPYSIKILVYIFLNTAPPTNLELPKISVRSAFNLFLLENFLLSRKCWLCNVKHVEFTDGSIYDTIQYDMI
jgi:hypothetical protein